MGFIDIIYMSMMGFCRLLISLYFANNIIVVKYKLLTIVNVYCVLYIRTWNGFLEVAIRLCLWAVSVCSTEGL